MYKIVNKNLYENGKVANDKACEVIKQAMAKIGVNNEWVYQAEKEILEQQKVIADISAKIMNLDKQIGAHKTENKVHKEFIESLKSIGFCAVGNQRKDIITGNKWLDHDYYCRNKKSTKGAKNGLAK